MKNTMGKVEETIGNVTGHEGLKTSGQERRVQGEGEFQQAQTQGYAEGTKDRALGKKDQLSGAVTGDTSQEAAGTFYHLTIVNEQVADSHSGRARNQQGQTQQDWNQS